MRRSLPCASASLFDSRILNCENLICRGIEEVITGLTRNQFVDNTTRGFESLPLRQNKNTNPCGWCFCFISKSLNNTYYQYHQGFYVRKYYIINRLFHRYVLEAQALTA